MAGPLGTQAKTCALAMGELSLLPAMCCDRRL
jgi:hypothetical protein